MPLPYPPWWIDQANQRRAALDAGVEGLRALLPSLPGVHGALVFGSYARNEIGPESDLDVIFIQETLEPMLARGQDLRGPIFEAIGLPYDLIVYTPEEFERFSHELSFVAQARHEGVWLDGSAR